MLEALKNATKRIAIVSGLISVDNQSKPRSAYAAICDKFASEMTCPCCEQDEAFLEGPHGGMSINIMCRFCGTRLNFTDIFGTVKLDWTHGPQADIWGGGEQTEFPKQEAVDLTEIILNRG